MENGGLVIPVFHAKGWWPKSSCPPSKVCLPWVSKRGIRDVLGLLPGCPGPLGMFRKFVLKKFVGIFRSPVMVISNSAFKHLEGADFRRKPQIFAENRRKPQIGLGTRWPFTGVSRALGPETPKKSEKSLPGPEAPGPPPESLEKVKGPESLEKVSKRSRKDFSILFPDSRGPRGLFSDFLRASGPGGPERPL